MIHCEWEVNRGSKRLLVVSNYRHSCSSTTIYPSMARDGSSGDLEFRCGHNSAYTTTISYSSRPITKISQICQIIILVKKLIELLLNHMSAEHAKPVFFKFTLILTFTINNGNITTINKLVT